MIPQQLKPQKANVGVLLINLVMQKSPDFEAALRILRALADSETDEMIVIVPSGLGI